MANPIKLVGCLIKGHEIDPKESIMLDVMINPNNLLCPCHRCGFYLAYDSMSGINMTLTKKRAYRLKDEFIRDMRDFIHSPEETERIRNSLYDMRGDTDENS